MKNLAIFKTCFILLLVSFYSCSDNDDDIEKATNYSITKEVILKNDWSVTNLKLKNNINISSLNGYKFKFTPEGEVTASRGKDQFIGKFELYDDNLDTELLSDIKLKIYFDYKNDFEFLNKSWTITKMTKTAIGFSIYDNDTIAELLIVVN